MNTCLGKSCLFSFLYVSLMTVVSNNDLCPSSISPKYVLGINEHKQRKTHAPFILFSLHMEQNMQACSGLPAPFIARTSF